MSPQKVEADSFVTIAFRIFEEHADAALDLLADGDDSTRQTAAFVHGYGLVMPVLEDGIQGKEAGARFEVLAEPADAYGEREPAAIFEVDKDGLTGWEELGIGDEFLAEGPEGNMIMRVVEIREDSLVVDTNHPLAGKRLRFQIELLEVRDATEDELATAQADAEELAGTDDGCGCGTVHSPGDAAHTHGADTLIQLGKRN